jgi:hypothetical protein
MTEQICPECKEPLKKPGPCPVCDAVGPDNHDNMSTPEPETSPGQPGGEAAPEPVVPLVTIARQADAGEATGAPNDKTEPSDERAAKRKTDEARFFAELKQIKEDKLSAVLFFGFRTAGKTWLLERMKYELFHGDQCEVANCAPPFEPVPPGGKKLEGSSRIEFHRVFTKPRPFVLIDINGEAAENLLNADYDGLRMLLAAMDYASAMIVALPSDILFFGDALPKSDEELFAPIRPRAEKSAGTKARLSKRQLEWAKALRTDNLRLEQFATGLHGAVGLLSYLRAERIDPSDEEQFKKVTPARILSHMGQESRQPIGGHEGVDCPAFFALTKADRVFGVLIQDERDPRLRTLNAEFRKGEDGRVFQKLVASAGLQRVANENLTHPWEMVRQVRKTLHKQLIAAFPLARFDYVTAFYGHDRSTTITEDHYRAHPQQGVYEILSWISDARRMSGRSRWRRAHLRLAAGAQRYLAGYRKGRRLNIEGKKR